MPPFDLADYEPVEDRLAKFWANHPDGRIFTELVSWQDGLIVVKASAWRDGSRERPDATGYAQEREGSSPVNRTSALENCETSAIGRALANLGYASKPRPSREEMTKASAPNPSGAEPSATGAGGAAGQGQRERRQAGGKPSGSSKTGPGTPFAGSDSQRLESGTGDPEAPAVLGEDAAGLGADGTSHSGSAAEPSAPSMTQVPLPESHRFRGDPAGPCSVCQSFLEDPIHAGAK